MKKLIINADDFGIHESVNNAVIQGYRQGCLTSTSLMPSGRAFNEAILFAAKNPGLGVGIHLTLVAEAPVSNPDHIPSLVDNTGYFAPQYPQFLVRYIMGKISRDEIRRELFAQVQKVVSTGLKISHIDSHQHLHIFPGILDIVIEIAKAYNIKAIRIPDEPYFFWGGYPFSPFRAIARAGLTFLARIARYKSIKNGIAAPHHFFGMLAGGNMKEEYLANILDQLPDGVSEIMVHPGSDATALQETYQWHYHWEQELFALTSDRIGNLLKTRDIHLVSFGELNND